MLCQPACVPGLFFLTASTSWIPIPNMVSIWGHPFFRCQERCIPNRTRVCLPCWALLTLSGDNREQNVAPLLSLTAEVLRPTVLSSPQNTLDFLLRAKSEDWPKKPGAKEARQSSVERARALLRERGKKVFKFSMKCTMFCHSFPKLPEALLPGKVELVVRSRR